MGCWCVPSGHLARRSGLAPPLPSAAFPSFSPSPPPSFPLPFLLPLPFSPPPSLSLRPSVLPHPLLLHSPSPLCLCCCCASGSLPPACCALCCPPPPFRSPSSRSLLRPFVLPPPLLFPSPSLLCLCCCCASGFLPPPLPASVRAPCAAVRCPFGCPHTARTALSTLRVPRLDVLRRSLGWILAAAAPALSLHLAVWPAKPD